MLDNRAKLFTLTRWQRVARRVNRVFLHVQARIITLIRPEIDRHRRRLSSSRKVVRTTKSRGRVSERSRARARARERRGPVVVGVPTMMFRG